MTAFIICKEMELNEKQDNTFANRKTMKILLIECEIDNFA